MTHKVAIKSVENVTHDVRSFTVDKPEGFDFQPGQATDVSIDRDKWRDEKRPFTFTSLPDWDNLQFTIKIYPEHDGVTEQLGQLTAGDHLLIDDPWGTITYKGPGTFIAGGAGITPFIAILRALQKNGKLGGHRLIFANKTEKDIILRDEFDVMNSFGVTHILSKENKPDLRHGRIDKPFLKENIADFGQHFYVCGPDEMVKDINAALKELGADPDGLVFEE